MAGIKEVKSGGKSGLHTCRPAPCSALSFFGMFNPLYFIVATVLPAHPQPGPAPPAWSLDEPQDSGGFGAYICIRFLGWVVMYET